MVPGTSRSSGPVEGVHWIRRPRDIWGLREDGPICDCVKRGLGPNIPLG
jgi:hypothetical protein